MVRVVEHEGAVDHAADEMPVGEVQAGRSPERDMVATDKTAFLDTVMG